MGLDSRRRDCSFIYPDPTRYPRQSTNRVQLSLCLHHLTALSGDWTRTYRGLLGAAILEPRTRTTLFILQNPDASRFRTRDTIEAVDTISDGCTTVRTVPKVFRRPHVDQDRENDR